MESGKKKLLKVVECLQKMKKIRYVSQASKDFTCFVQFTKSKSGAITPYSFGLMCLNPSYIFKRLLEEECPRSVILTSGTLSPLSFVMSELKTKFKVQLVNKHIIERSRVCVRVVDKDLNGKPFLFNYQPQNSAE